jgi:hypothetical protein
MSNAEQLKQAAIAIFGQMRERRTKLQSEYDVLQSKLAYKKAELDAQIDILSSAYQRMLNFKPFFEGRILCPRCWVVNGKQSTVGGVGQGGVVRCDVCHQEFPLSRSPKK